MYNISNPDISTIYVNFTGYKPTLPDFIISTLYVFDITFSDAY